MFKSIQKILCIPQNSSSSKPKLTKRQQTSIGACNVDPTTRRGSSTPGDHQRDKVVASSKDNLEFDDRSPSLQPAGGDELKSSRTDAAAAGGGGNVTPKWQLGWGGYWYGPIKDPAERDGLVLPVLEDTRRGHSQDENVNGGKPLQPSVSRRRKIKVDRSSQTLDDMEEQRINEFRPETVLESSSNGVIETRRRSSGVSRREFKFRPKNEEKIVQYCITESLTPPALNLAHVHATPHNAKFYDLVSEYRQQFFPASFSHIRSILDIVIPYIAFVLLKHSGQTIAERVNCLASINHFLYTARECLNRIFLAEPTTRDRLSRGVLKAMSALSQAKILAMELKKLERASEELMVSSSNDDQRVTLFGNMEMFSYVSKACGLAGDDNDDDKVLLAGGGRKPHGLGKRSFSEVKFAKPPSLKNFQTFHHHPESFLIKRAISH